jgi:hypothetical protein
MSDAWTVVRVTPRVTGLSFRDSAGNPISTVTAGTVVTLRVDAVGMNGQTVSVDLWEDDGVGDNTVDSPHSIPIGSNGIGTKTWTSRYVAGGDTPYSSFYLQYGTSLISSNNVYSGPTANTGHFTVTDTMAPSKPVLTAPANGSSATASSVAFNWNASTDSGSGIKEYRLEVANNSSFTSPTVNRTLTGTSSTETLSAEGTYYWRVTAYDNVKPTPRDSHRSVLTTIALP